METIKSPDERKWFQLLERATIALEKIAKIEAPNKPAAPVRTEAEQLEARRKNVSVVSRPHVCRWPGRSRIDQGGLPPEIFFSRRERD
jgi:hypothetical protein